MSVVEAVKTYPWGGELWNFGNKRSANGSILDMVKPAKGQNISNLPSLELFPIAKAETYIQQLKLFFTVTMERLKHYVEGELARPSAAGSGAALKI